MSGPLTHELFNMSLRLGAPPTAAGRDYVKLAVDLRLTALDVVLGGAIAVGVVWAATRHLPSGVAVGPPRSLAVSRAGGAAARQP